MHHPVSKQKKSARRVSGEKGLGRLSAARLGNQLEMLTKSASGPCWQVNVAWPDLMAADDLQACKVELQKCKGKSPVSPKGTLLRITDLNSEWDGDRINELKEQLSRLITPFSKIEDFKIWLTPPGKGEAESEIEAPTFLSHPLYSIKGHVNEKGFVDCTYHYKALAATRTELYREPLWEVPNKSAKSKEKEEKNSGPTSGPFDFEIRVWDIDTESVQEISQRFDAKKSTIRKDIRTYRGVSLYRDRILVLPKSDAARDWLGLDLRRVSKIGIRLSTSQIVGYVSITAEGNKDINDTSDRERLEDNQASQDLIKLLWRVVGILEDERSKDKEANRKEPPFKDLFAKLSAKPLIENISHYAEQGGQASEVLPLVEEFGAQVEETVGRIQQRLIYYSRLASLGVLAAMLVHEVRNHTLTFGRLFRALRKLIGSGDPTALQLESDMALAEQGAMSLDQLADRFAPLASRAYRSGKRDSVLEEIISSCLAMRKQDMESNGVSAEISSKAPTTVAVDPGELTAVILNLVDNALYWLSYEKDRPRRIEFQIAPHAKDSRVAVRVDDTGPGVRAGDEDRIFWPGITLKPEGLGMGLTVASEIVAQHEGKMMLEQPGRLDGASFVFDLPQSKKGSTKK
jgi:signal transduction histidine kinase